MTSASVRTDEHLDLASLEALAGLPARGAGTTPDERLAAVLDRAEELVHREPQTAERLARGCEERCLGPDHEVLRARARYQRAQVAAERGELSLALSLIAEARAGWTRSGQWLAGLRTDLGRMHVLDDLGRHHEAIEVGEQLIRELDAGAPATSAQRPPVAEDPHRVRLVRAHAVKNLGVAYGLVGRHDEALVAYARAESAYRALDMPGERARALANRGVELLALGRPAEALADFDRATEGFEAADDQVFAAQCCGDAAQAHRQLGQVGEALTLLEEARRRFDRLGVTTEAARLRTALAETHLAVGMWQEARDAAAAAAEATAGSGLAHDEALARFLVALAELALDRPRVALAELAEAQSLFERVADRQYLARVVVARAQAHVRLGEHEQARHLLTPVVDELTEGGWAVPLVGARLLLCDLTDDPQVAAADLTEVSGLVRSLDVAELTYELELRYGRLHRRLGDDVTAERHFRQAIEELADAAGAIPDHAMLTTFRADRVHAHAELVDLLVERNGPGDVVEASRMADDVRARTLTDLLSQAAGRGPVLSAAGRDLGEAFAELSAHYLAEQQAGDDADLAALARRTEELERRVSTYRLRHLGTARQAPVAAPAVRAREDLTPDTATVAYHVSLRGELLAFVHGPQGPVVRRLPEPLARVHELLDDLDDQWSRIALMLGLDLGHHLTLLRSTQQTLHSLYVALLAPVADLLDGAEDRLCIVPDGRLGSVPFAALHDGDRHLAARWAVTVAPTLAAVPTHAPRGMETPSALVVAVPDYYAPSVEQEARTVAELLPGARVLQQGATVAEFVTAASGASGLVHVACHGVYRPEAPLFSRLRLRDRWMTSAEIVQLDLRGALVVLSACESGAHGRATEPVGLGWAFLAAGARGVLVSHWAVDDTATTTLMSVLYRHLAAGVPADEALRRAQRQLAESHPHPYFWGAFSYVVRPGAARDCGVARGATSIDDTEELR